MRRRLAAAVTMLSLLAMICPLSASADVNNFQITNFTSDETLSRHDKQGELTIVEQIDVDFTDYNHGILRAIPNSYHKHRLQLGVSSVTSNSGAPHNFTTYQSNGNTVLKIGDPNRTVTGQQSYTIAYRVRNVISFYKDHDELYWNVNGDQWPEPFEHVSVQLHLPSDVTEVKQPVCYTGSYGSNTQACSVSTSGGLVQAETTAPLAPDQTLTYVAGFSKGYFQPSTWYETAGEYTATIAALLLPILILGGGSLVWWLRRGRDPKGSGVIVPQYTPPDGLKPMEVGTIIDFKLDNRDITATIVDLAVRGYIRIIESKQDHLLRKDTLSYSLEALPADRSQLNQNEMYLLDMLFFDVSGTLSTVDLSSKQHALYETMNSISKSVEQMLTAEGYFRSDPLKSSRTLIGINCLLFFTIFAGFHLFGWALSAGIIVGAAIGYGFARAMAARTTKGVAAKEHILGLKLYLEVAEKDRLEKLQAPNAAYAPDAQAPVRTVELFEKLLPYAITLGVEKQWASQFANLYSQAPSWYAGNWSSFNTLYLVDNLGVGLAAATNSAFSAPSSSGSSGFGGGFAGGGGGGGGGGGW